MLPILMGITYLCNRLITNLYKWLPSLALETMDSSRLLLISVCLP